MTDAVRHHYETYPYPDYPLLASVRRCDTYALNLVSLWSRFNGELPPTAARSILIAGCGSFAPYPFGVSNPDIPITALDLSQSNLKRARMHCLLHGIRNVSFLQGDLLDQSVLKEPFGFIDSFGVLHHLSNPIEGLKSLATKLADRGIIRVMVYSRYARQAEEAIRHSFRLLGIRDVAAAKNLLERAKQGSRLRRFVETSYEARSVSGLADALLHPCVKTFRINEFMELINQSGLKPLLFAHKDALEDVEAEVDRIRDMESRRTCPGNFIIYLGQKLNSNSSTETDQLIVINPCIIKVLSRMQIGSRQIASRLGHMTILLGQNERSFLRRFIKPVHWSSLSKEDQAIANTYIKELFLLKFRRNQEH